MTRRVMYDSTNVADIPKRAKMAAGYVDGRYVTFDQLRRERPHVLAVQISVNGSKSADVIDRETGDVDAKRAAQLVDEAKAHTVYCNLASLPAVLVELRRLHLERTPIWTAHWTGRRHLCGAKCFKPYRLPYVPTVVATQYADPKTSGGHYDVSLVAPHWPGVDLWPAKPKAFTVTQRAALDAARRVLRRRAKSSIPLPSLDQLLVENLESDARRLRRE